MHESGLSRRGGRATAPRDGPAPPDAPPAASLSFSPSWHRQPYSPHWQQGALKQQLLRASLPPHQQAYTPDPSHHQHWLGAEAAGCACLPAPDATASAAPCQLTGTRPPAAATGGNGHKSEDAEGGAAAPRSLPAAAQAARHLSVPEAQEDEEQPAVEAVLWTHGAPAAPQSTAGPSWEEASQQHQQRESARAADSGSLGPLGWSGEAGGPGGGLSNEWTCSLSSGLSPQGSQGEERRWDHAAALQALAGGADAYGRSAFLRRQGRCAGVSAADALPARLAAQHLGSLAGMSRRVQGAILQSQRVLERQAATVERAALARAFYEWRHVHGGVQQRRHWALAARHRVEGGHLRRCLHAWRRQCADHERQQQALARAGTLLSRGMLRRCWQDWRRQRWLRLWKVQLELRDGQIQQLGTQIRHLENRPVRLLARHRLRSLLRTWQHAGRLLRAKRATWAAAERRSARAALRRCLGGWQAAARDAAVARQAAGHARRIVCRLQLRHLVRAWRAQVGNRAAGQLQAERARRLRQRNLLHQALGSWRYLSWFEGASRTVQRGRAQRMVAGVMASWRHKRVLSAAAAALLAERAQVRGSRLVARSFDGWAAFVEGRRSRRQAEDVERLTERVQQLAADGEQLRRENERLCRVIDSGDWGRQRVEELLRAGQVLGQERDALAQLVGSLQQQQPPHDAAERRGSRPALQQAASQGGGMADSASAAQQAAGCGLPRQGAGPCARAPQPASAPARNKLVVRTGSSFAAMVRALKQDLLASGALERSPGALLEVDKLSLNRLSVAVADEQGGAQVEVRAVGSPDRRGVAFGARYPPSPPRQQCRQAAEAGGGRPGSSGSSSLLEAALRLRGMGGRSVGLQKFSG